MAEELSRIRVAIADDEPVARDLLRALLARDPEVELVAECADGETAVAAVREHEPDLLLLDVQMPGMSGFDVVEELGASELPLVIFATAHDRHALRAFEIHAVDYLLKPFDPERFGAALRRAKERLRARDVAGLGARLEGLLALLRGTEGAAGSGAAGSERPQYLKRVAVQRGQRVDYVDVRSIDWIEAADQYVRIHAGGREHLMRGSLTQLERALDPRRFARVHRSAIVALDRVRSLEALGDGSARLRLEGDLWLPVGRSRISALRERLG